jgi:hypothetical protein
VERRTDPGSSREPPRRDFPWQFAIRAVAVVGSLTLLLVVSVKGLVFFLALGLIALSVASEAAATVVYWRRSRG